MQTARRRLRKYVCGDEEKRVRDHLRENIHEKAQRPEWVKLIDKVSFTLGVLNISICQYFLFNQPSAFWVWYSLITPILLYSRMKHFKRKGWHYFLLDFCYFTLLLSYVHLFLLPHSRILFNVLFIYANGPLTWAILLWRNSFVFHDYDKITSVYIHILPAILTYTERCFSPHNSATQSLTTTDYATATAGYIFWQTCYYLKTEHLDRAKLDSNPHLLTSLRWLSRDDKNFAARKVLWLVRRLGFFDKRETYDATTTKTKVVFMLTQFSYTLLSFVPTWVLFRSAALQLLFLAGIMTVSIFFGASYYIEVFSERYHLQFKDASGVKRFAQSAASSAYESLQLSSERAQQTSVPRDLHRALVVVEETASELTEDMLALMSEETEST